MRLIAGIGLTLLLLAPSVLVVASVGIDVNLFAAALAIAACLLLNRSLARYRFLWVVLGAVVLAIPPYPLWLTGNGAGDWVIRWSPAIFARHPYYYFILFVADLALLTMLTAVTSPRRAQLGT
jgi:hypothetical protein